MGQMDSLFNLLANRVPDEPAEIRVIKGYVRQHFNENVLVMTDDKQIIITVRSAALAGTLRARGSVINKELAKAAGAAAGGKRLVFRIGQVG